MLPEKKSSNAQQVLTKKKISQTLMKKSHQVQDYSTFVMTF